MDYSILLQLQDRPRHRFNNTIEGDLSILGLQLNPSPHPSTLVKKSSILDESQGTPFLDWGLLKLPQAPLSCATVRYPSIHLGIVSECLFLEIRTHNQAFTQATSTKELASCYSAIVQTANRYGTLYFWHTCTVLLAMNIYCVQIHIGVGLSHVVFSRFLSQTFCSHPLQIPFIKTDRFWCTRELGYRR